MAIETFEIVYWEPNTRHKIQNILKVMAASYEDAVRIVKFTHPGIEIKQTAKNLNFF